MTPDFSTPISRRRAIAIGGGAAGSLLLAPLARAQAHDRSGDDDDQPSGGSGSLPVEEMQSILQAQGSVTSGVLSIELDRTDIGTVYLNGVPIKPSFQVNGTLTFQSLGGSNALFNGDLALKPSEVNPFIDAILANKLIFQALHQHFYDFEPDVWFIHWRGTGDALDLARRVHNVVLATSTPLPQAPPSNPTTPLDPQKLQDILGGDSYQVGSDGVVTVSVTRKDPIYLGGIRALPDLNIETPVAFEPLNASGSQCAVVPDFGMEGSEIPGVMSVMRAKGWDVGCLYNQETDEQPQLYFSHQFKTGDPYVLAAEVRAGLDLMDV